MINFFVILFFIFSGLSALLTIISAIVHIYRYWNDAKSRTFRIEIVIMLSLLAAIEQFGFMVTVVLEEFIYESPIYNKLMRQVEWNFVEGINSAIAVCGAFLGAVVCLSMLPSVGVIPRQGYVDFFSNRYLFYGLIIVFLLQSIITGIANPEFVAISVYQAYFGFCGLIITTSGATVLLLYWYSKLTNLTGTKEGAADRRSVYMSKRGKSEVGEISAVGKNRSTVPGANVPNPTKADVNRASKGAIFRTVLMFVVSSLVCILGILDRNTNSRTQGLLFDKAEFPRRDVHKGFRPRHFHALLGTVVGFAFLNSDETKKVLASFMTKSLRNSEKASVRRSANEISSLASSPAVPSLYPSQV